MNTWHPLRLAALIITVIATLLCFADLLKELKTFVAFLRLDMHSSLILPLLVCSLPTGLGTATVVSSLGHTDGSRQLSIILSFCTAAVIILSGLLQPGNMPGLVILLFIASGVLLIIWPRVAMPHVGQLLQQRTRPYAPVAAQSLSIQPETARTTEAGTEPAEPADENCAVPPHADGMAQATTRIPPIVCPSCQNTVSSQARQCPHCGQPFRNVQASRRSRLVALLLCFFLGCLGIHRFYVGKFGTGALQLLTLGGLFIWSFIDLIFIACGAFRDDEGKQLTEWTVQ